MFVSIVDSVSIKRRYATRSNGHGDSDWIAASGAEQLPLKCQHLHKWSVKSLWFMDHLFVSWTRGLYHASNEGIWHAQSTYCRGQRLWTCMTISISRSVALARQQWNEPWTPAVEVRVWNISKLGGECFQETAVTLHGVLKGQNVANSHAIEQLSNHKRLKM